MIASMLPTGQRISIGQVRGSLTAWKFSPGHCSRVVTWNLDEPLFRQRGLGERGTRSIGVKGVRCVNRATLQHVEPGRLQRCNDETRIGTGKSNLRFRGIGVTGHQSTCFTKLRRNRRFVFSYAAPALIDRKGHAAFACTWAD